MQAALDLLYLHALQLFAESAGELELAQAGLVPQPNGLLVSWNSYVRQDLTAAELRITDGDLSAPAGRSEHTPHLERLVADMQQVARLEAGVVW
jgi:1,2-phenylacetyl-CoA epoxidase catalytic subunit